MTPAVAADGTTGLLAWDTPARAQPYQEWASYQADSTPPGTYQPNMSDADKLSWKARLRGQRGERLWVEVRKSVCVERAGSVQVKMVVHEDGRVETSMNGTARWSRQEFDELSLAVEEARRAMAAHRGGEESRRDSPGREGAPGSAGGSGGPG